MKRLSRIAVVVLWTLFLTSGLATSAASTNKLRIVLVPERNIFDQERKYRYLCDYACKQLPVEITFDVLGGYREVLKALDDGKADGAFMGSYVAALGVLNHGLVPLARPEWPSGESHYRSYIFKRSSLPVTRDLATWKGRSFVFVSPHTSAGYFFPLALLRDEGIKEPGEFFSRIQFSGSHDASVWMVANDIADLGAAKNTIFDELLNRKPELADRVEILYTGGHFPDSTLCLKGDVPKEVREAVRTTFVRMSSQQEGKAVLKKFGAVRFVPASADDFDGVYEVLKASGHDLLGK